jgi:hypothetical protein
VNRLVKVSKELVHWLAVFVVFCISFWVAGHREPKDGFRYFVTALVVAVGLWALYYILACLLPLAWSRWRRSTN